MRIVYWSDRANEQFLDILEYWFYRNKSDIYSNKLISLFDTTTRLLAREPLLGKASDLPGVRMKLVRDYWIFYSYTDTTIHILQITGTQQNPQSFYNELPR